MKPRNVTHLQLMQAIFVPGYKQLDRTITRQFYPDVQMSTTYLGVLCNIKGHEFLIPWTMIQTAVLERKVDAKETIKAA